MVSSFIVILVDMYYHILYAVHTATILKFSPNKVENVVIVTYQVTSLSALYLW